MNYQFFWPAPPLRPYIQFYAILQKRVTSIQNSEDYHGFIPPYPCKGLIFSLTNAPSIRVFNDCFDICAKEGYLMPQCTQSWIIEAQGSFCLLGVFFRPGMLRHFFKFPIPELVNQIFTFEEISHYDLVALQDELKAFYSVNHKINLLENYLLKQLSNLDYKPTWTDTALNYIQNENVHSLDVIKDKLGISSRYFRKVFQRDMGISPKAFLKVHRFNKAFQMMKAGQYGKFSDIAYQLGYFDQSHFIQEFKHFMQVTPLQFFKQENLLENTIYWQEKEQI